MSMRPTLGSGSGRPPSTPSGHEPTSERDEIRSALISAVCHAHQTDLHREAPPFLKPMPLDQVVDVLRSSRDRTAGVLAACWLLDNPQRAAKLVRYAAALIDLDEPMMPLIPKELLGSISFDSTPKVRGLLETRFAYAYNALRGSACNGRKYRLDVSFDPYSLVTNVIASVEVNRPASDFQKIADPRCWEDQAPLFFKESKLCDLADGDFGTRPNPGQLPAPPPPKYPYGERLLEHVTLGFAPGFPLDAINVLKVDCDSTAACPTFNVSLHACLETLLGPSFARGGLDVDGGTFLAEADPTDPNWTRVSGTKRARFTEREVLGSPIGRLVNLFAPFCLAALMSMLVFEGACA